MKLEPNTPVADFKFKGHTVKVPQPAKEGGVLTANEAKFFNRSIASVTGNIFASAVNRALKKLTDANAKPLTDALALKADDPTRAAAIAAAEANTSILRYPADHEDTALRGKPYVYTQEDLSADDANKMFAAIIEGFEPGVTSVRGEGIARDPIESIADNIAWERIKVRLGKAKIKVSSVTKDKKEELIDQLHKLDPSIMETAKSIYEGNTKDEGVDAMLAGIGTPETPAGADTTAGDASDTNTVTGGEGNDSVGGDTATDTVGGGEGSDTVEGGAAPDVVTEPVVEVPAVEAPAEVAPDASEGEATPASGAFG